MSKSPQALTAMVLELFRAHKAVLDAGDALVAPIGLSSARWQVLGAVALAGRPLTVPDIARDMGLTRQGVRKQVAALMQEGLMAHAANPAHRRSHLVELTAAGLTAYRKADRRRAGWMESLSRDLSAEHWTAARLALQTLRRRLEESS